MRVLVTGGAGFVGCNLSATLLRLGHTVIVLDNLSRSGSETNLAVLADASRTGSQVVSLTADVRDADAVAQAVARFRPDAVAHLAGQVAVTDSVLDPVTDFQVNACGTLNVLEAVRQHAPETRVLFTSTNKVYGTIDYLRTEQLGTRYRLPDYPLGLPESLPLRACSPYGCSKLAADIYVRDYSYSFGLATTVFRMSCIYGNWQHGTVDQGWVSWMVKSAIRGDPIMIFGDGLQVRDLLHVDDLVAAMTAVLVDGRGEGAYNIGGGPDFSVSIWAEFSELLKQATGRPAQVRYAGPRLGDQKVYISDIRKVSKHLDWKPTKPPQEGVIEMTEWLRRSAQI